MPEIKNYEGKKRRPHHEMEKTMKEKKEEFVATEQAMDEAEAINTEAQNEGVPPEVLEAKEEVTAEADMIAEGGPAYGQEPSEGLGEEKVHLEFYGSELIRQKAPKVMEIADTVANEWKHDGQFQGLPLGNPLAQMAAAKALRTAKDVEKKLEEKGVIAMAKMGLDFVKSKIEKKNP